MNIKLLYVEDEPFLAQIVQESLASRDFDVKLVTNGQEAIKIAASFKPEICVLDIMLPGKNGYEVAKEIRTIHPSVPIIFLTAKTQTTDLLKGFEAGGNDYLKKPFSMEELIVRVHNLLQITHQNSIKKTKKENSLYNLGRLVFYPDLYELHDGEQVKKLSFKENAILQMLAENIGQAVERKEILLKLWGDDSFYNSRNLDVYINKLREHLKTENQVEIITIKGVGYHLIVK